MKHELWYSVVVRDRQGRVVSRERRRSKSFLKQWNQGVYIQMAYNLTLAGVLDTDGNPHTLQDSTGTFVMNGGAGVTDFGIRVGTGNTPVAIDDYALKTPIAEGIGAGQMEHLVCTITNRVVSAPSCSHVVSRTIVNNSPGVITVREAAIYMTMYLGCYCATRDVLVAPQAVPIGGAITIDWTLQVTV